MSTLRKAVALCHTCTQVNKLLLMAQIYSNLPWSSPGHQKPTIICKEIKNSAKIIWTLFVRVFKYFSYFSVCLCNVLYLRGYAVKLEAYLLTPTIILHHFKFVTVSSLHWKVTKFQQAHKKNNKKKKEKEKKQSR